jgi:MoaA/NifB/PqqE/SkfB family radical SAM enzyme
VTPTPRPDEGVVSWNVNTTCNYRCSYCTQRFKEDRGRWARDTPRFLEAFARVLEGPFELKLSGGEPFVHPTLLELVAGLVGLGHRVSVVTNFSAKRRELEAFADAARGRVGVFSCSLHLEYVDDVAGFADKAAWMASLLAERRDPAAPAPGVCVTVVATRENLPRLDELARIVEGRGVTFKVQPEKQDRDVVAYEEHERRSLMRFGGHNRTGRVVHAYQGLPCWAGSRYFILDDRGDAFRCYPARRYKIERMGSLFDPGFRLAEGPSPCLYATCNCTVPIARKMMPTTDATPDAGPHLSGEAE